MLKIHRIHFETIDSTNHFAKTHLEEFDPKLLTCITADVQTSGYGRFSRRWVSEKGNLMVSFVFSLEKGDSRIANLSQLMALSVAHLFPLQIKWPNDLVFDGKKVGGFLAELVNWEDKQGIILGMGLNVNADIETDQETTTLKQLTGKKWDLEQVLDGIVNQFQKELEKGFSAKDFEAVLAYKNEWISCQVNKEKWEGIFVGIDEKGRLKLQLKEGTIKIIDSADIERLRQ